MFDRLKQKWNIQSNWDLATIMLVFSLAGMSVTLIRKPLFLFLGFTAQTPLWIKTVSYLIFILPTYQTALLFFALCFGQLPFFWAKQKEVGRAIKNLFAKKRIASNK